MNNAPQCRCGAPRGDKARFGEAWTRDQCRMCWLWLNDQRYQKFWSKEVKEPGLVKKAGNFGKALIRHIQGGGKTVTVEIAAARLHICTGGDGVEPCPLYIEKKDRCRLCGCGMKLKVTWETSECPAKKW